MKAHHKSFAQTQFAIRISFVDSSSIVTDSRYPAVIPVVYGKLGCTLFYLPFFRLIFTRLKNRQNFSNFSHSEEREGTVSFSRERYR